MEQALAEIVGALNRSLNMLCGFGFGYCLVNFITAASVAFLAYPLFLFEAKEERGEASVQRYMKGVARLTANWRSRRQFLGYLFRYSTVTGICAAALIDLQYGGENVKTAIFYGILGPYVLKDKIGAEYQSDLSSEYNQEMDKRLDEAKSKPADTYERQLAQIKKNLNEKGDDHEG